MDNNEYLKKKANEICNIVATRIMQQGKYEEIHNEILTILQSVAADQRQICALSICNSFDYEEDSKLVFLQELIQKAQL
jgi:hypothetical protein